MSDKDMEPRTPSELKSQLRFNRQRQQEAEREERKLRHWIVRALVVTLIAVILLGMGAIVTVFIRGGNFQETTIGAFLQALTDIIKFLMTPAK